MVEEEFPIGYSLRQVLIFENQEFGGDELCLDQLLLFFDGKVIILEPLADTDEIVIIPANEHQTIEWLFFLEKTPLRSNQPLGSATTQKLSTSLSKAYTPTWCSSLIDKKLQTVWVCKNAQGYFDKIDFAFERLHPSISLIAEGSVLKVFRYEQIHKLKASPTALN